MIAVLAVAVVVVDVILAVAVVVVAGTVHVLAAADLAAVVADWPVLAPPLFLGYVLTTAPLQL